ncbi:uncharacterized protein Z518_06782 [Rhinocladiella mackenziei CBS 650.93]|uniref:Histone transcription regulator 3 homolog n=1 Tax=Rhinocladiella mackenziei CBS 650.93 TaxID=1442369 RepID=A0A0D2J2Q4_9EURO|nr:uncharacterized protein Z518_06782 [Rhinocladiella mackenziei CBS 650.93]KIX03230.1 hypothetical protein Z518_06782 [Rhinocladiella mackenziei CBS 650.93]
MSGFTALNVEPEDSFDEEIDDTREIQLEEAFKLYQNALKLHSQGPQYFQEALEAYQELLQSEVFKYPEFVSDFTHEELDDEAAPGTTQIDPASLPLLPSNAAESSASSVPQLIYLAFKNRGQFVLDVARHQRLNKKGSWAELCQYYAKSCHETIRDFAKALERDDTDLDLWKKAARVSDVLSTQRIARFCLESVLAGDDDDAEQSIDLSGLDEAFAAGELQEVVDLLQDDLGRLRSSDTRPRDQLLTALRETNDPYPFLPKRAKTLEYLDDRYRPLSFGVASITLQPASNDLSSLGQAILHTILGIQDGFMTLGTATTVKIEVGNLQLVDRDAETMLAPEAASREDQNQKGQAHAQTFIEDAIRDSPVEEPLSDPASSGQKGETLNELGDGDTIEVRTVPRQQEEVARPTSRKRSSTAAGNDEPEGRTKSKRIRARESLADLAAQEDDAAQEDPQYFNEQLAIFEQADQATFDVVNSLLAKLDMRTYLSTEEAKNAFWRGTEDRRDDLSVEESRKNLVLLTDLRTALRDWSDEKSQAIIYGHGTQDFVEKSTGMSLFLQHSKPVISKGIEPSAASSQAALVSLVHLINAGSTNIYDAAFHWLFSMLVGSRGQDMPPDSSYLRETWPAETKQTVVQLAITIEPHLYEFLRQFFISLTNAKPVPANDETPDTRILFEFVETLFEIYLDVHSAITNPSSQVEQNTRIGHGDRLMRWATLANDFMHLSLDQFNQLEVTDPLILRFIWASTAHATLADEVDKSHVVLCLEDLKRLLQRAGAEAIYLPNNAAMPVISILAVDQEISRLSTLDFFTSVFDSDNSDPVAVIEKLEPILEPGSKAVENDSPSSGVTSDRMSQTEQLIHFLASGDAALKLFLWRRLQNAYTAISYGPKIVSCLLRAIETCVDELYSSRHIESEPGSRQISMLKWLRDIDELMTRVLVKLFNDPTGFECVDDAHLRSSLRAMTAMTKLLHGFVIYEDSVRVGQTAPPQFKGASLAKLYDKSKDRLKEMLVRAWILQYMLLKEATVQDPTRYNRAADDLAEYLCTVHHAFGVRYYCRHANKAFVKLVKWELGDLATKQDYSDETAQVFFDLYQLRFASGVGDANHGCPPENMDKKTAWSLIPTIMKHAEKFSIKDLIKNELKGTIDKIQQTLGAVKNSTGILYNKRIISGYLKSTINPRDLYRCIRGIGDLPTRIAHNDTEIAASSGWYFLLGYLTLAKYKSVKRVNPTPTDDLDIAVSFFRQELDHGIENWETWYRLAQVYEAKIEDDLIWNSVKLNESRGDIALLERQTIHCYIMAIALAMRSADDRPETAQKMEDMLTEFATRLYASSRPPLNMEAFKTDKYLRHMSSHIDQTMSKEPYHKPLGQYALWHFAVHLLSMKFTEKPKPWTTHYTRAKCLWKMFQSVENCGRVSADDVLEAIIEAIETLPKPKKEKTGEPILEPHFKLVSVIHKMVRRHAITYAQAEEYMQATRYAQGVHLSKDDEGVEWVPYVLEILKKLGQADKSNWHHRITDRAAHVIYEDDPSLVGALGAKHQFTQQIFTKSMTVQVWKPEYERPGRHYVYTGRYVSFFVHLLEQLKDRANLDQLVRRIRRKTTDFIDHIKIWEEVVTTYVRLLRRIGKIDDGYERALFDGMNHEEFTKKSEKMEKWAHNRATNSVYLDIMREAIDLKRLNNSLLKGPIIDDLIGDSYACLYDEFVAQLPPEEQPKPQPPPLPQGTFINMTTELANSGESDVQRARLHNMLRAQGDGAADGPLAISISTPVGLGLQNSPNTFAGQNIPEVTRAPAKPGRTKTVTRREIQRKAEAAIVKPPPIKTPVLTKKPILEMPSKTLGEPSYMDSPLDKRLATTKDKDIDGSGTGSRRGSVQDSADGEADEEDNSVSELSELEDIDDEKKQLLSELANAKELAEEEEEEEEEDDGGEDGDEEAENGEDTSEDVAEDVVESDEDGDGADDSVSDLKSDREDEEMVDAEDEIEIQDSQENVEVPESEEKDTPGDGEEQEFHEAQEEHDPDPDQAG